MDKYKVIIEEPAIEDLREIYKHIAESLMEPQIAEQLVGRIRRTIEGLALMPERFPLYDSEPWRSQGVRRVNIGNFAAFYIVLKEDFSVSVLAVIYSGRDIGTALADKHDTESMGLS